MHTTLILTRKLSS